jgi:hypothetical protein
MRLVLPRSRWKIHLDPEQYYPSSVAEKIFVPGGANITLGFKGARPFSWGDGQPELSVCQGHAVGCDPCGGILPHAP